VNAQEHIEAAEAWLETGETAWRRFTHDKAPRDPGELRKAEVAIGLAQAHAALASLLDRPQPAQPTPNVNYLAPNGLSIPVSPVAPRRRT
jgi:hypothetical protein